MVSGNPSVHHLNRYVDNNAEGATYGGIAWKAGYFVLLAILSALVGWRLLYANPQLTVILLVVSAVVTLVCAVVSGFAPKAAPIVGTIYGIAEGFMVGCISALFDAQWSGIVLGALLCTMVTFGMIMILYSTGAIRVGNRFRKFLYSALLGILVSQLLIFLLSLFIPSLWTTFYVSGPLAIVVSVVMVLVASLCILNDVDQINLVVQNGLPKAYEWTAAFSLAVSLIWLYVEFLRLFAIIASSRN